MLKSFIKLLVFLLIVHQSQGTRGAIKKTWKKRFAAAGIVVPVTVSNTSSFPTATDLAIMTLDLAITDTSHTHSEVELMLQDPKWYPIQAQLEACLDLYTCAFSSLKQAAMVFKAKKYKELNDWAVGARDCAQQCEDEFQGVASPLSKENSHVVQLCSVIIDISSLFT